MNGDLEVEIGAASGVGEYVVRVVRAAAGGEPVGAFRLDVDELLARRSELEATVLASAVKARRSVPAAEESVRRVGEQLFQALFTGSVYGSYRASLGVAQQRGKRLRVVLRLTAPELAALPWEALFDPETETYLCRQELLVRHVPAPYTPDPLEVRPPLRILGLVASPRGLPPLDVEVEQRHLAEALAEPIAAGLVELVWVPQATWGRVHAQLLAGEWHVLHFVGHGDYDTHNDEGVLALVGEDGRAELVEASRLADLLGEAQPTPRLVVLNSCSSGEAGAGDLFSGTAAALVRSGISAVAAMQFTVSDDASIAFARGFYTAIAHGRGVDEAARSGRIAILGAAGTLEWITPVLYLRGEATHLFTLTAPSPEVTPKLESAVRDALPPQPAEKSRRRAELRALYVEARAEMRVRHYDTAVALFDDLLTLDPDYSDAAEQRDIAERERRLAVAYLQARTAEDAEDWTSAIESYAEILSIDPAYRDAEARKTACETRQRIADLQAELRHHADNLQWQAVLDVDAELARLDPTAADPDGLASTARSTVAAEQRTADLERRYTQARAAEDADEWATAVQRYAEILGIDPAYRDTAARNEDVRSRLQVAALVADLRAQAQSKNWEAVLAIGSEIAALDRTSADPDGLATQARQAVQAQASHSAATSPASTDTARPRLPEPDTKPSQQLRGRNLVGSILWGLIPVLSFGLLAPLPVALAAVRLRDKRLWLAAGAYTVLLVTVFLASYADQTLAGVLWVLLIGSTTLHSLLLGPRVFAAPSIRPGPSSTPASGVARWAPDPTKRHQLRYWDGQRWTHHVADDGQASDDPE